MEPRKKDTINKNKKSPVPGSLDFARDDRLKSGFWRNLKKPFFVLAPMAGYTDAAFRLVCREQGADVTVSELISADAIAYSSDKFKIQNLEFNIDGEALNYRKVISSKNQPTADLLSFFENERPFVVQLFGKNPENFGKAVKWITKELEPDGIDINMGCPAKKVIGSEHGAALLKKPDLAVEIVKAVKENTNLPVSVKTRLGWDNDAQILEFAPLLLGAGIDAISVHGRTYRDGFKGEARWENIFKVKKAIGDNLIVVGNGDIRSIEKLKFKIDHLLDGYMIGRASFGQPQIFNTQNKIGIDKEIILRHAKLNHLIKGELGILEFRKHLLAYIKGFPGAKELRKQAVSISSLADIELIVGSL